MARPTGSNRGRLLLVMLIVSSLLLITLDLRGVAVVSSVRSGVGTALTPVEKVGNWVITPIKNLFSDLIHLGRTRNTINNLKEENAKLRAELTKQQNSFGEAKQLKAALDLAGRASWKVVNARVLAQGSTISFTHTITIDQGSRAGIKPNLTVVNGSGLVGVVKTVFPNSSVVLLASDPAFKIGVRVARNQSIGILSGQGSNSGILELLENRQLPFFIKWLTLDHPSTDGKAVSKITKIEIAGDKNSLTNWVGSDLQKVIGSDIEVIWVDPAKNDGEEGIVAVYVQTPSGEIRLD
mgnify:CR=1 FL=1